MADESGEHSGKGGKRATWLVHISREERFDVRGKNNGLEEAMATREKPVSPLGLQRRGVGN